MPRRAAPGDRARIEAALSPSLLAALEELRELFDVVDWRRTPLGPPFQLAACVLLAAQLHRDGVAPGEALHEAADHLGIERETVRSWARRWSTDSRVHSARAPAARTPASLVSDVAHAPDPLPRAS